MTVARLKIPYSVENELQVFLPLLNVCIIQANKDMYALHTAFSLLWVEGYEQ